MYGLIKGYYFIFLVFLLFFSSCGLSRESIIETVKTSMQQKFDTDPNFKNYHFEVTNVYIVKKNDYQYQGLVDILWEYQTYSVSVDITVDGEMVMWQAAPQTFLFVAQKEFEKAQKEIEKAQLAARKEAEKIQKEFERAQRKAQQELEREIRRQQGIGWTID